MGMSASQARLIALTARMSDTEYEAQQINQQRLTLSNKMNEVYEMMCNMEVPTPPSKIDYKKEQFSGKIGGNNISVIPDSNTGEAIAYQETEGPVVQATAGTMGGSIKVNLSEAELPKGERTDGVYNPVQKGQTADFYVSGEVTVVDKSKLWVKVGTEDDYDKAITDDTGQILGFEKKDVFAHPTSIATSGDFENAVQYYSDPDGKKPFTFTGTLVDINDVQGIVTKDGNSYKKSDAKATHGQKCIIMSTTSNDICQNGVVDTDPDRLSDEQISSLVSSGIYYVSNDGENSRPLEEGDFKDGKLNSSLSILKKNDKGTAYVDSTAKNDRTVTSADGKKTGTTMEISEAKSKYGSDFETAMNALRNRYESSSKTDSDLEDMFRVVVYSDGSFAFVLTTDFNDGDSDVQIYEVTTGKYNKKMDAGTYTIERDTSGNVNKITTSTGATSALNTSDAYDELAYDAAMASYTAQKAEYDQEQNRLNKQTSIYQRQDKQLELKLTRLDNERNALNTEIEAVKKVIQDAIDRGFKTFSG